jgi:hypothetical protein
MAFLDANYEEPVHTKPKTDYFSLGLFFLGGALFVGGLIWYFYARLHPAVPTPDPDIVYQSTDLTDEELMGAVETDFNLTTGTASENLGIVVE